MDIEKYTKSLRNASSKELSEIANFIRGRMDEVKMAEHQEMKERLTKLVHAEFGSDVDIGALFKSPKGMGGASKTGVKYRNPDDPSQTYGGRGPRPKWLVEAIENGSEIKDFEIAA